MTLRLVHALHIRGVGPGLAAVVRARLAADPLSRLSNEV